MAGTSLPIRLAKSTRALPAPVPAAQAPGDVVAVFDVQDSTGRHRPDTLDSLSEYLATKMTEAASFQVVPRSQIRARLVAEKTASYKECFEQACQIELGKAVAARKSLSTRVLRIGDRCVLTATLFDLKSESAERAASAPNDCSAEGLMKAVDSVAAQLGGAGGAP
jgi:TolB-like protein